MPCTEAVVMMMKITSSTYARSSIGGMLISSYTSFSSAEADMLVHLLAVVFGDACHELVDEDTHVGVDFLDLRVEPVVAEQRRYRDRQPGDRRGERCRDARRNGV